MANFVVFMPLQIVSAHLCNILACFRLSSLKAPLKQAQNEYSVAIMPRTKSTKVILMFLIVLHNVIQKPPHYLRMTLYF